MRNRKLAAAAIGATAGLELILASLASATPITFDAGGGSYTYNISTIGTTGTTGDPNAVVTNAEVFNEYVEQPGNKGIYYVPDTLGTAATVSYTFDAAPGETFSTGSADAEFTIYYGTANGEANSYVSEAVTTNLNSTATTVAQENGGGPNGVYEQNSLTSYIAGANTFTLTFTLYADPGLYANFYDELFREDSLADNQPFLVTTTSAPVPEPASAGLLGLTLQR
jgi:hypothetical protein